jgi:hypothetical protein
MTRAGLVSHAVAESACVAPALGAALDAASPDLLATAELPSAQLD